MNKIETVSTLQMAILFQAFMTGSSILNIQGPIVGVAQTSAWISILIGNGVGFVVLFFVLFLYKRYPTLTFVDYTREIMGGFFAILFTIPLVLFLFLLLSNITYGMGQFFTTSMMRETPLYIYHLCILLIASLTVYAGIEVMARMFHMLLYFMIGIIVLIFLLAIPNYETSALLPILPNGWKPVLHAAYITIGFPYVDIMLFSMVLPFTRQEQNKSIRKWLYLGLLINGFLLLTAAILPIMGLGPLVLTEKFPLYQLSRLIDIGEVFQRMESVFGMALILGSYMKITLMLFILNITICKMLRIPDYRQLTFVISLTVFLFSVTMFKNEIELAESGSIMQPILAIFLVFLPLSIVSLVALVRRKSSETMM